MSYFGYLLVMDSISNAVGKKALDQAKVLKESNEALMRYIMVRPNFSNDREALDNISKIYSISDAECLDWSRTLLGLVSFDEAGQIEEVCSGVIQNCECYEAPKPTKNEKL